MNSDFKVLPVLFIIFFILYTIRKFEILKNFDLIYLSREQKLGLKNFFSNRLHYFNQLSEKDKNRFILRAYKLAKNINVIGKDDFKVTSNVKLFIVAAQVQLTFGFNHFSLNKFHTILVYPDSYRNKITGKLHFGEVNPMAGVIVLSWNRFVKGFNIPNDRINLGLHEMAHALMHAIINNHDHEIGVEKYLRSIVRISKNEMEKIQNHEHHLFRSYAAASIYEFFAVAVEYFFEVPDELQKELPNLYFYLTKLLKQDPVNKIYNIKS